jgi:hypothetical protein
MADDDPPSFTIRDCALLALATGKKAAMLPEFLGLLQTADPAILYYHFWGNLLNPRFEEREYNNDFAAWTRHHLHDAVLAERLAVVDPLDFADLEQMRGSLVDMIEERLEQATYLSWLRADEPFEFIHSQIVVFDTDKHIDTPEQLTDVLGSLSTSSVFYHFIDARRRTPDGRDDFSLWLTSLPGDYSELCRRIANIDPYFGSLSELRGTLMRTLTDYYREP